MKTHVLKVWPAHYGELADGRKPFEVRNNDRGYEVGDELELHCYDPDSMSWPQVPVLRRKVISISTFQQRLNYVVLGLATPAATKDDADARELREIDGVLWGRTATDGLSRLEAIRVALGVCQRADNGGQIAREVREALKRPSPESPIEWAAVTSRGFRNDLARLINWHSREKGSNTPDFILAAWLERSLELFDVIQTWRAMWFSEEGVPAEFQKNGPPVGTPMPHDPKRARMYDTPGRPGVSHVDAGDGGGAARRD